MKFFQNHLKRVIEENSKQSGRDEEFTEAKKLGYHKKLENPSGNSTSQTRTIIRNNPSSTT